MTSPTQDETSSGVVVVCCGDDDEWNTRKLAKKN